MLLPQVTAAAVLPLREEQHMKSYLLQPAGRRQLLAQQGGRLTLASALGREHGVEALLQVSQNTLFLCMQA